MSHARDVDSVQYGVCGARGDRRRIRGMYLKRNRRRKDGKEHIYWNIVESKGCTGGKVVQRQVLYLGEINDSQRAAWGRVIEAFDEATQRPTQVALFAADRAMPTHVAAHDVQVRL